MPPVATERIDVRLQNEAPRSQREASGVNEPPTPGAIASMPVELIMAADNSQFLYTKNQRNVKQSRHLNHIEPALASRDAECYVATAFSQHARDQAQRRGIGSRTLDLILIHHD